MRRYSMPFPVVNTKPSEALLEAITFLRESPLFTRIPPDDLPILAAACKRQVYARGDYVVRPGEIGREFFVIVQGKASMWIDAMPPDEERDNNKDASPTDSVKSVLGDRLSRLFESSICSEGGNSTTSRATPKASVPARIYGSETSEFERILVATVPGIRVCTLRRMDYFGERSLIFQDHRCDTAIIVESLEMVCLKLSAERFKKLNLTEKLRIPKRRVVPLVNAKDVKSPKAQHQVWKNEEQEELVRQALQSCEALRSCLDFTEQLLQALVEVAWCQEYEDREVVVGPDESADSCILMVQKGCLEVVLDEEVPAESAQVGRSHSMRPQPGPLVPGSCYGAHTLLYETMHNAPVISDGDSTVWKITSQDYCVASKRACQLKIERYAEILSRVDAFAAMLLVERHDISEGVTEQVFSQGQTIYAAGSTGETFYVLIEGEVQITRGEETVQVTGTIAQPAPFGEHALAQPLPLESSSSVVVISPVARCLSLQRGNTLARSSMFADIKSENSAVFAFSRCRSLVKEDLKKLAVLGRGAFGFVELMQNGKTKELYALKTMKKAKIARTEYMKKQVMNEKYILELTDSIFITKLYQTSKSTQDIYFLLEPCLGGELYTVYINQNLFGKEDHAIYYSASVACAFEHLHERYIIYRDLKPENLLLDEAGRLKLTDMGLAKFVMGETSTVCGTPSYFPPEVAIQTGYTNAVDWWQLGILVWELLARSTPFVAQTRGEALYWLVERSILRGLAGPNFAWPKAFSQSARKFLASVLHYEPSQRCNLQPSGAQPSLIDSPWYEGFQWSKLKEGTLQAPFVPPPVDLKHLANFNNQVSNAMDNKEEYVDDGTQWDEAF